VNQPLAEKLFSRARVQTFQEQDALIEALVDGTVTAAIGASPAPEFLSRKAPNTLYLPARRGEAFAIRKGDADFLAHLDTWVRYCLEDGWLAERRHYWFETFAWEDDL